MATMRLPGLLSGIDTAKIVEQLMMLQRRTLMTWETRKSLWEEKQTALSDIEGKLTSLRTTLRALSDASELKAYSVSSSDKDFVTAEATNDAFESSHNIVVNRLATAERWVHTTGKEYAEDYVGEGTFIYSYNHLETNITTTATTTLEELVGLINNDADNPGVTASLLNFNDAYHLVLSGKDAGGDYGISVNTGSTEVWTAGTELTKSSDNATLRTLITDLDQFGGTLGAGTPTITIAGDDHDGNAITPVDLVITSNTKISHIIGEINDAFDGVAKATLVNGKIVLTDDTDGASGLSVTLTYNANGSAATFTPPVMARSTTGDAVTADLAGFAEANFSKTQSALDSEIRVDGYPFPQAGIAEVQTLSKVTSTSGGTFTLTYNGETTTALAHDATTDTIENALEALSNIDAGDITVSGLRLNQAGDMTFTFLDNAGDVNMLTLDSSALTPSESSNYTMTETTKGNNYGWIRRSSNTIDDVISGITLHLHDVTGSSGEDITLTRDIDSLKDKINLMVTKYNSTVEYVKEKTGYNEHLATAGILMGDYVVSTLQYKLREPLIERTKGFIEDIDEYLMPVQLGLELDRDGVLSFNENTFDEAVANDYMGVLAILGADKSGSSTSNTVGFYGASNSYTTAGEYDVQVTVSGGVVTSAQIRLSSESTYRNMIIGGSIITGISSYDTNGDPDYAEHSLQLNVDLSVDGDYTATVRVKQGFTGKIEDQIDKMLKATVGTLIINQDRVEDQIDIFEDKIELEEYRLIKAEDRLVARFARLEKTLVLLQNQMAAASILGM
ncbi:MAG: hypothetical protein FVQ80_05810 [Planctomycetes bacterium]|nr:hypothetical protein [Planctomycetota bacterium]